ncbi:MAG: signal peptidase I [Chloroflexota bacterium]
MTPSRRWLRRTLAGIVFGLFALLVFIGYGTLPNAWYRVLVVTGASMEPALRQGDLIVVTPPPDQVKVGMVLVLDVDGRLLTHRVSAVAGDGTFTTKGDANPVEDDFGGRAVRIFGTYAGSIPVPGLGRVLPVPAGSAAAFTDHWGGSQQYQIGSWIVPAPGAQLVPAGGLVFGNVPVGGSADGLLTLRNSGSAPLHVSAISLGGSAPGQFAIDGAGSCPVTPTLGPDETCTIGITFAPTTVGDLGASLVVTSDAAQVAAALAGTGTAPGAQLVPAGGLAFGNVPVGTTTGQTITLRNSGSAPLHVSAISLGGSAPGQFAIVAGASACTAATILGPGATCDVTVRFSPTSPGAKSATVKIGSNAGLVTADLTGTGVLPGAQLTPSTKDFGDAPISTMSSPFLFTLTNTGGSALHVSAIALTGADATQFEITGAGSCVAAPTLTLDPGAGCTVAVRFRPTATGVANATLRVTSDADQAEASVTGRGTAASAQLTPATFDFGSVTTGSSSAVKLFTLTNAGTAPLHVSGITPVGTDATLFTVTTDGTCTAPSELAAGAGCTIGVRFAPTAVGSRSATLRVTSTNAATVDSTLTGTGAAPLTPGATLTPTTFDFGNGYFGQPSSKVFTLKSTGTAPVVVGQAVLGGTAADQFAITADGCSGQTIAPAGQCTITVAFVPTTIGDKLATLTVPTNVSGPALSASLHGLGCQAEGGTTSLSITPATFDFGSVRTGDKVVASFTVTNAGTAAVRLGTVDLSGTNANQFSITSDGCGRKTLAAGATCTIKVAFKPGSVGLKRARLSVAIGRSTVSSTLTGTGIAKRSIRGSSAGQQGDGSSPMRPRNGNANEGPGVGQDQHGRHGGN